MKFSINLNKIALLRNARGEDVPNIMYFAEKAIELGVDGLTLHPRPDQRHATCRDVIQLCKLSKDRGVEFNIEGNPFSEKNGDFYGFCELVNQIQPEQVTLVPDEVNQITSEYGWKPGPHDKNLENKILNIRKLSPKSKISLFIDDIAGIDYASSLNLDTIEIHTGQFSKDVEVNTDNAVKNINYLVKHALDLNLLVNAGHDLNINNLHYLKKVGNINEVSIGHAVISDSLIDGFEKTLLKYIDLINE